MKLRIFLSLMLLMAVFNASAYYIEVDGIVYIINGNEATVTKSSYYGPEYYSGDVVIPETVTEGYLTYTVTAIGDEAFAGCTELMNVMIPNTVSTIGKNAFECCSNLTSIDIPNSVTFIDEYAFFWCSSLSSVTIGNSVTTIGPSAFLNCENLYNVTIGNSVTTIGEYAFSECYNLRNIDIPNSVTYIGDYAFSGCEYPTNIFIPSSVTHIGTGAFSGAANVWFNNPRQRSISVDIDNPYYDSRDNCNAIIETSSNTLIAGCQNTIIPNTVTSIGEYAFDCCEWLTSVTIPNSVTSIGRGAFFDCCNLKSVTIGNSVTTIGEYAFTITRCVLKSVTCLAITPPACISGTFTTTSYCNVTLYVPAGSLAAYREADGWKEFVDIRGIGDIDGNGMLNIRDLTSLIDLILNGNANVEDYPGADVNGDGDINITDVTRLIDQILSSSN